MIALVIQARTGSGRLPGKVLAPAAGRPLLGHLLERMGIVHVDAFVVATTTAPGDDAIAALATAQAWAVVRGSEADVLSRFLLAAAHTGADAIVRVTADCPLLDPATVNMLISRYRMGDCDHVEAGGLPDGAWCEVVSVKTLQRIAAAPDVTPEDREHVTLYARRRPLEFRLSRLDTGLRLDRERWSVDTAPDLAFVRAVLETLPAWFTFGDVRRLIQRRPALRAINAGPLGPIDTELLTAFQARAAVRDFAPAMGDL